MAILDPNRLFDGFESLEGGVDAGRLASLLSPNECVEANNVVFRGGPPKQRPPIRNVDLTFENPNLTYFADGTFSTETGSTSQSLINFGAGLFQGALYFAPARGKEYIMASIGGRQYKVSPSPYQGASVRETILERRNSSNQPIAYMVQAGIYHITQDAESKPIIFDGVTARRAGIDEIFVGQMMAVGQGRIVLIGLDGLTYFGDIRDGKGNGDADMLGFTETQFLNEGFPSALPPGMGQPMGIVFLPQQDAATGVGDCIVFGENGAEGFTLAIPRDQWKDSQFQRPVLRKIGLSGHRNIAEINNDIWFHAQDGWRSYRQARAEIDRWAHIPLSTNVRQWIDSETKELLQYGSVIAFDNRLIATTTPIMNQRKPYHNGALALDFDVISSFGETTKPAWDGHWGDRTGSPDIGIRILQLVEGMFFGRQRAFAFVLTAQGKNVFAEIGRLPTGNETGGKITSRILTRKMTFNLSKEEKELYGGDYWVDEVEDDTSITFSFRPDSYPTLQPWYSDKFQAIDGLLEGDATVRTDGFSPRRRIPKPSDLGEPLVTKRIYRRGCDHQFQIEWTGRASLRGFRPQAQRLTEDAKNAPPAKAQAP